MDDRAPEVAAFLAALEKTERMPAERLRAYRRRLLERLIRHAAAETGFYPDRLRPLLRGDGAIDWGRWAEVPVLSRAEARANVEALYARTLPAAAGAAIGDSSSGSTGMAFEHRTNALLRVASAAASERFFRWHRLRPDRLTARIRAVGAPEAAYPHGRRTAGWRIGHPQSTVIDLAISAAVEEQRQWLERVRPAHLISYPSNLRALAQARAAAGGGVPLEKVLTVGEMVGEDLRAVIAGHFGTAPLDRYGATEIGHVAGTCPDHGPGLHVASELVHLELLDAEDRPVPPGTPGRVVVTSFYNYAMPLIRYDIGDHAAMAAAPCRCGRSLPVLEKVLGRTRNMFRLPGGRTIWPVLWSGIMHRFVPSRQFQVVQRSETAMEYRYVPVAADQANDLAGLTRYFRQCLHPDVTVTAVPVAEIPRSAGGKYEDYVSLVTA